MAWDEQDLQKISAVGSPHWRTRWRRHTPLRIAIGRGQQEVVLVLLDMGADQGEMYLARFALRSEVVSGVGELQRRVAHRTIGRPQAQNAARWRERGMDFAKDFLPGLCHFIGPVSVKSGFFEGKGGKSRDISPQLVISWKARLKGIR
jgi:hypothetical protein